MNIKVLLLMFISIAMALGIQNYFFAVPYSLKTQDFTYQRVIKNNELRCAYALFPHYLNKDPNTGELSGVMVDLMDAIEKGTNIKISWGPEIDYSAIVETLQTGKADAFCGGLAMTPSRGRVLGASTPFSYSIMAAYVRADDIRFDNAAHKINQPETKIEVNMGDFSEEVAKRFFPKATLVYRGAVGGEDQLFLDVAMKKADITFSGPSNLSTFNTNNPQYLLRIVPFEKPIYNVPIVIGLDINEGSLMRLINTSLHDLIDNGAIDQILQKNTASYYKTAFFPAVPRR